MAITATYKQKTSPKITKLVMFDNLWYMPFPLNEPAKFGQRSNIDGYRREIKNFSGNLAVGGLSVTTLDVGSTIATHLAGSHLTGEPVEIQVKAGLEQMKVFKGFVGKTEYSNGVLKFDTVDRYYNIRDAKFEFDYKSIRHSAFGYTWGTVIGVQGSCVYFRIPDQTSYSAFIHTPERRSTSPRDIANDNYRYIGDEGDRTVSRYTPTPSDRVRSIYRMLGSYDKFITEANFVKFAPPDTDYSGLYNSDDGFDSLRTYRVTGQLNEEDEEGNQLYWYPSGGMIGIASKEGTLEIDGNFKGVKSGYQIFFRLPLYLAGNPVQIIGSISRGDYNNLPETLGTIPIDSDSFATLSAYCQNMHAFREFTDSSKGDVANTIQQLAEESFIDVWVNREGTMHFSAIRPYGNSVSTEGSFYNDENAWGFRYSDAMDDVAYRITGKFGIRSYPDYQSYDLIERERLSSKIPFNGRAVILDRDFEFYHDDDEAVTFMSRELFWRRHGVVRWEWEAPLFGLDQELGSYTTIRTEQFPAGSHIVYVDSIEIDLQDNLTRFSAWDYTNCFLNYYILQWQGNAIANPTTVTTATSNSGWSRLDPSITGSMNIGVTVFSVSLSGSSCLAYVSISPWLTDPTIQFVGSIGWHFKYMFETGRGLTHATVNYRVQRLFGSRSSITGSHWALGTTEGDCVNCGKAIPQLKNSYGDFVAGTVQNLSPNFGSTSIFW